VRHPDFRDCAVFMARLSNGAGVLADVSYSAPSQVFSLPYYWEFRIWCDRGVLSFCYNEPNVTLFEDGGPAESITYSGKIIGYIDEFLSEIHNNTSSVTENVLASTQTALLLQEQADKEWNK